MKFNNDVLISLFTGFLIFLIDKTFDILLEIGKTNKEITIYNFLEIMLNTNLDLKILFISFSIFLILFAIIVFLMNKNKELLKEKELENIILEKNINKNYKKQEISYFFGIYKKTIYK